MTQTSSDPSSAQEVQTAASLGRFWEWLWQGSALKAARNRATVSPRERLLVDQARALLDLGERVRDRVAAVMIGSADLTALMLFHKAGLTALTAYQKPGQSNESAWGEVLPKILATVTLSEAARLRADQLFPQEFPLDPAVAPAQVRSDVELLHQLVSALMMGLEGGEREVSLLRWLRILRLGTLTVLLSVILVGAGFGISKLTASPNLLAGIAPQTSSTFPADVSSAGLAFHTNSEQGPWALYDLGAVKSVSDVEVQNRGEGLGDRAIPLVVEVSLDNKKWSQVARRDEAFERWKASFGPVGARYLKLTVKKVTYFHLVSVKAH